MAINRGPDNIRLAVFVTVYSKIVHPELPNRRAELTHQISSLLWGHIPAHVLAIEPPQIMKLGADKESVLFPTANLRTHFSETFKGTLVTLLGHVVHPHGIRISGGDVEIGLVHI